MAWIKEYPNLKQKSDLVNIPCVLTGTEPNPLGKGMFEVNIFDTKNQMKYVVVATRRDLQAMMDSYPQPFTFEIDPKDTRWANVVRCE
jgi:hypothetical protein